MKIKFTRHAQRRAKLYNIPKVAIYEILMATKLAAGRQSIVKQVAGFAYPLKVVVMVANRDVTVITNYPLKRGKKR